MTGSTDSMGTQALARERAAREQLERRLRERDELIATIAHDLRTPLNTIIGWVQLLRSGGARDLRLLDEGLEVVERSARQQTRLVSDFADASRLASGRTKLALRAVDLRAIVEAAAASTVGAGGRAVRVEPRVPSDEIRLDADPERLARVFATLIARAAEASPDAPVAIEAVRHVDAVEIRIAGGSAPLVLACGSSSPANDHGTALKPVFEARVDGLEAFLVRSILELHGGALRPADSAFVVTLPLAETFASR